MREPSGGGEGYERAHAPIFRPRSTLTRQSTENDGQDAARANHPRDRSRALCSHQRGARAGDRRHREDDGAPPDVTTAVREGALLPSTLAPRVGATAALAFGFARVRRRPFAPIGSATAEVRVWGPFAIRGGAEYSTIRKEPRPTIGGRVQLLRQEQHGIDGSFSVFYRPEGFTEPEGEIESFISLGRRFERISRPRQPGLRPGSGGQRARRRDPLRVAVRRRPVERRHGLSLPVRDRRATERDGDGRAEVRPDGRPRRRRDARPGGRCSRRPGPASFASRIARPPASPRSPASAAFLGDGPSPNPLPQAGEGT